MPPPLGKQANLMEALHGDALAHAVTIALSISIVKVSSAEKMLEPVATLPPSVPQLS